MKVLHQRLSGHDHPLAVADALEAVPRSRPFESWLELGTDRGPRHDCGESRRGRPGHPLAIGERYAATIPGAKLVVEEPGKSPIAWQGGQLSKVLGELAE